MFYTGHVEMSSFTIQGDQIYYPVLSYRDENETKHVHLPGNLKMEFTVSEKYPEKRLIKTNDDSPENVFFLKGPTLIFNATFGSCGTMKLRKLIKESDDKRWGTQFIISDTSLKDDGGIQIFKTFLEDLKEYRKEESKYLSDNERGLFMPDLIVLANSFSVIDPDKIMADITNQVNNIVNRLHFNGDVVFSFYRVILNPKIKFRGLTDPIEI